jgi:tetratricopeptide (TPR) repeat protein
MRAFSHAHASPESHGIDLAPMLDFVVNLGSNASALAAIAIAVSMPSSILGQSPGQNVSQQGTSRAASRSPAEEPAPSIDVQTGRVLNEAIELMNADDHAGAARRLGTLQLDRLSPYERGTVERILFSVAYAEDRYEDARGHLQKAIESGGLNAQQVAEARYQSAQLFIQEEKWREGAAALEEWFETATNPNSAAYYFLAAAYYQLEDSARALAPARRAVELMDPARPNENWLGLLSALHLQREEYREAIPLLEQLIEAAPHKTTYWLQLSSVYQQVEDYPHALAVAQLASNAGHVTEDADVRRLADLLLFNGVPYRGGQVLEAAIERQLVTLDDKLYEKLANCWIAAGELEAAVAPLQRAAALAPSGDVFVRLGELHVQREDWAAAITAVQQGIDKGELRDPGNAELMIGVAHYNRQSYEDAVPYLERARRSDRHRQIAESFLQAIAARQPRVPID